MVTKWRIIAGILLLLISVFESKGQGSGPRSFLLSPKGVTGIDVKWLHLNQNLIPAGTALIPGADIGVDVFPVTLFHTFSIKGRVAQVYAMVNPGKASARIKAGPPIGPIPTTELKTTGLSDGFIAVKLGIIGAPAMDLHAFSKSKMRFSAFADVHFGYSGTYEQTSLLNLGTNRSSLQIGFPMAIPLNTNRLRATWVEVAPFALFFAANNDPARSSSIQGVGKISQKPLYIVESHLTHNLNPKFWVGTGLRFQYGGQTYADDKPDNNTIAAIAGGLSVGYQFFSSLNVKATYGKVLVSDEAKGTMLRISMTFSYANRLKSESK